MFQELPMLRVSNTTVNLESELDPVSTKFREAHQVRGKRIHGRKVGKAMRPQDDSINSLMGII